MGLPNTQSNVSKTASLCIAEFGTEENRIECSVLFGSQIFLNVLFLYVIKIIHVYYENKR